MIFLNKKIFAGTLAFSSIPIGVFTSNDLKSKDYGIIVNFNGQADLLLSLQIPPDYYPYRFKRPGVAKYLTNFQDYFVVNEKTSEEKKSLGGKIQRRINELLGQIKEYGPSLWSNEIYESGIEERNDQFWNNKKTSLLIIEQFLNDDYADINESFGKLPIHKDLIVLNHRVARDPYLVFSEKVFECIRFRTLNDSLSEESAKRSAQNNLSSSCTEGEVSNISTGLRSYLNGYEDKDPDSLYRFGRYINFWNDFYLNVVDKNNKEFLEKLLKKQQLFSLNSSIDSAIAEKYQKQVFSDEDLKKILEWVNNKAKGSEGTDSSTEWKMEYRKQNSSGSGISLASHSVFEQNSLPGSVPLSEGSQKDLNLFVYQAASAIEKYSRTSRFSKDFKGDQRSPFMKNALNNSQKMINDFSSRVSNIRNYFKKIGVVDNGFDPDKKTFTNTNSKTFTVVSYPISSTGSNQPLVNTISRFPFIYHDIGLRQPYPSEFNSKENTVVPAKVSLSSPGEEMFTISEDGWGWKIGNNFSNLRNLFSFKDTTDTLLFLSESDDWRIISSPSNPNILLFSPLLKGGEKIETSKIDSGGYPVNHGKYEIWEGSSPISLNLMMDHLVDIFQKQYDSTFKDSDCYQKAMDWGEYWKNCFAEGKSIESSTVTGASAPSVCK